MEFKKTSVQSPSALTVITTATAPSALRGGPSEHLRKLVENNVPVEALQQNFNSFLEALQHIVAAAQHRTSGFVLEEVAFSAEIGANGEFKLLGTGVEVSAGSAVTFTLRRGQSKD